MKVSGSTTLHAPAEQVFAALNDPSVLVRTIPGCEQLEALGGDRYRMTISAGVASITGTYLGDVALTDPVPPSAFTLRANGSGTPGTVTAEVRVTLDDNGDGTTLLRYDADAVVGGPVGGVGQRVLTGVARKTAGEFFDAVNAWLAAPELPLPELAAPAAPATPSQFGGTDGGQVFRRPPGARPARAGIEVNLRDQLPGVLVGALIALLAVFVGWRLGRASRREG
jgi:carbon monoxide dehydrogenase subunit G